MVKVAIPLFIVPVPSIVGPSRKVTVPVAPVLTEAVKVTAWLTADGLSEDVSTTAGLALLTVCVVVPVPGLLFVSPP